MKRILSVISLVAALALTGCSQQAPPQQAVSKQACNYTSVQARVQPNNSTPWTQTLSITQGQSFTVGAFKNGWGVLVDAGSSSLTVRDGSIVNTVSNLQVFTPSHAGTYYFVVQCGSLSETATVTVTSNITRYDLTQFLFNPNTEAANVFSTYDKNGVITAYDQPIRAYKTNALGLTSVPAGGQGFYIAKNFDGSINSSTDFEEYYYDASHIRLVRDTSWDRGCDNGEPGSFELRDSVTNTLGGKFLPRFVDIPNGGSVRLTVGDFFIVARSETTGKVCESQFASPNQPTRRQLEIKFYPQFTLPKTGKQLNNVLTVAVLTGPGEGETYYYARDTVRNIYGWVGFGGTGGNVSGFLKGVTNPYAIGVNRYPTPCTQATSYKWWSAAPPMYTQVGFKDGLDYGASNSVSAVSGYLAYGPYDPGFGKGTHRADAYLWIDNNVGTDVVATMDVTILGGRITLARKNITRNMFSSARTFQWIPLTFNDPWCGEVEVRVFWNRTSYMKFGQLTITKL